MPNKQIHELPDISSLKKEDTFAVSQNNSAVSISFEAFFRSIRECFANNPYPKHNECIFLSNISANGNIRETSTWDEMKSKTWNEVARRAWRDV